MHISVDGFEASADKRVGVGRLEVELLKALYKLDDKNSFRIYTPGSVSDDLPKEKETWKYRICSISRMWRKISLPAYLYFDKPKPDVFFAPIHYAPEFYGDKLVLGIMDLSFIHFPAMFRKRDLYKLTHWTKDSVIRADAIIAISKSTKNDIIESYGIKANLVHVIYPGLASNFTNKIQISKSKAQNPNSKMPDANIDKIKNKYGITGDYLLYVGTLQPRKNLIRLTDAFKKLGRENLQLVIVGKKGWMFEDLFKKVEEERLLNKVVFTGYVPEGDLPYFYKGATCFCLVSLYEGFGFPVLEAMQAGVPVVCSNVSSLPEVAGGAAVLVDPESADDIAKGIEKVLKFTERERKEAVAKGREQAKKFTWEKTARETLKILEEVGRAKR